MIQKQDIKLTELDYLIGNPHSQMVKAALPYMNVPEQKFLSLMVKVNELQRTMQLFNSGEMSAMGLKPPEEKPVSPVELLNTIKPYGSTYEQDLIDVILNVMQGFRLYRSYQETAQKSDVPPDTPGASMPPKPPWEQLKSLLSPEQQSRMETMQMVMQPMQQFT